MQTWLINDLLSGFNVTSFNFKSILQVILHTTPQDTTTMLVSFSQSLVLENTKKKKCSWTFHLFI